MSKPMSGTETSCGTGEFVRGRDRKKQGISRCPFAERYHESDQNQILYYELLTTMKNTHKQHTQHGHVQQQQQHSRFGEAPPIVTLLVTVLGGMLKAVMCGEPCI
jgi:hypothetical protein